MSKGSGSHKERALTFGVAQHEALVGEAARLGSRALLLEPLDQLRGTSARHLVACRADDMLGNTTGHVKHTHVHNNTQHTTQHQHTTHNTQHTLHNTCALTHLQQAPLERLGLVKPRRSTRAAVLRDLPEKGDALSVSGTFEVTLTPSRPTPQQPKHSIQSKRQSSRTYTRFAVYCFPGITGPLSSAAWNECTV
jgi:hypothetical protein